MFLLVVRFIVRSDFCSVLKQSRSDTLGDTCTTPGPEIVLPVPLDSLSNTESMQISLSVSGNTMELEDARLIAAMAVTCSHYA